MVLWWSSWSSSRGGCRGDDDDRGGGVGASVVVEAANGWRLDGVWAVVMGMARGGVWYSGSYRSDDEEKIWDLAGKTHRKTFLATADGGRRWGSGGCRKWGREKWEHCV
ncbi:hypothetical protein Tco_0414898 [Tanacetum coccineum]